MLLRFKISTAEEHKAFYDAANALLLDVWSVSSGHADVRVRSNDVKSLIGLLPETMQHGISTLSHDLSENIANTYPKAFLDQLRLSQNRNTAVSYSESVVTAITATNEVFFQDYQPLPARTSFEGREITGIRIGVNADLSDEAPRKTILVIGGLHAREWVSTSSVNYLAWAFATRYNKDHVVTKIVESFDIIFVPVLNPDGFEYTWSSDRLWRKSRQPTGSQDCHGLDLDHTFSFGWEGSSVMHKNPCSEGFAGVKPFEAIETLELSNWARNVTQDNSTHFVGLIDLHSYSQQVLFPYSHSCHVEPPNLENLEELAAGLTKAIRLSDGGMYTFASACEGSIAKSGPHLETGGGSAIDWFHHEMQAHFSYQIKLQDTGVYGFLLPREYIIPSGEEMFSALKYFGDYLLGNNGIEHPSLSGATKDSQDVLSATDNSELKLRHRK
ncbi:putative metallocarboxypeptidase ecm14 [Ceratocystis pirilliformis]|uniref:Inactive metallocarboxypeptidase ECM14 n=1 Tax=Ceratocystis pirilliformis TaxID=259994 RepID=A0ABR3ZHF9_9PEZI